MRKQTLDGLVIVAFLQNMWVQPHQVKSVSRWSPTSEERERMIHYALFAGCVTGKRLKAAFGEDLCSRINWQEASPVIADNPRDYHPPDSDHIVCVMGKYEPDVVLCFTKRGECDIRRACAKFEALFISLPHPACRRVNDTMAALGGARVAIETLSKTLLIL